LIEFLFLPLKQGIKINANKYMTRAATGKAAKIK
jgi:hypothetical protein